MALGFYFTPSGFTRGEVRRGDPAARGGRRRSAAGAHLSRRPERDGEIQVFDIWESQEALDAFGPALMPILAGLGVDAGRADGQRVHNVIEG